MAFGRPMIFETPEAMEQAVQAYFDNTDKITLAGLALALGMSRKSLYNYEGKDDFLHIIKKAREFVEAHYEERAVYNETQVTGTIFALKNMGWSDATKQTHEFPQMKPVIIGDGPTE
jgi:DNA-packaging protein gp3